ncbi:unnamed protein product [Cunninghamella echinulata]
MAQITIKAKMVFLLVFVIFFILKFAGIFIGNWSPYNNIINLIVYCVIMGILYFLVNVDDIVIGQYTSTKTVADAETKNK